MYHRFVRLSILRRANSVIGATDHGTLGAAIADRSCYALEAMRRLCEPTSHPLKDGPIADYLPWKKLMDSIEAYKKSLLKTQEALIEHTCFALSLDRTEIRRLAIYA